MRVIVGLGNPGPRYEGTRHNVGFMVTSRLAEIWSSEGWTKTVCRSRTGEGVIQDHPVRLVQPQTLMNASGEAVGCLLRRWRLEPSAFLIVCDDVSLPLGLIRLRARGSDGGHRGLASILEEVGTDQVARLRVGIQTTEAVGDLTTFVLSQFHAPEKRLLEEGLESAVQACEVWVTGGVTAAMNRFNKRVRT